MITPEQIRAMQARNEQQIALGYEVDRISCAQIKALLDEHALLQEVAAASLDFYDTDPPDLVRWERVGRAIDALRKARGAK